MSKTILITGAGSGFGEAAAIGMARNGHNVIASVQFSPHVTPLREKARKLGLKNLRVEKLDLFDPYDVSYAQTWEIDVLWNNVGSGESGLVFEIPVDLVRRNYEVNVLLPLALTQGFVKKWIPQKKKAKIVFTSSMGGLSSGPPAAQSGGNRRRSHRHGGSTHLTRAAGGPSANPHYLAGRDASA
jgi:NAD(P)-dependent dehydrogenase (short-subunit alcohol dehydrogenase family)